MSSNLTTTDASLRADALDRSARALVRAERSKVPIAPLTDTIPDLLEDEAYAIAARAGSLRNTRRTGWKLGYTSAAMRRQMGISQPNYGQVYEGSGHENGATVAASDLIHPLVEPEVAFLMARDLAGPGVDRLAAWEAIATVCPSLEIVDTRYREYSFTAQDNIADNSSAARHVLGTPVPHGDCPDLVGMQVQLLRNGEAVDEGSGHAALGDPVLALAWLANRLAANAMHVSAGEVVLTGGLTRAHPVQGGDAMSAQFEGLGDAHVRFG